MNKRILINGSMITTELTGVGIQNINLLKFLIPKLLENDIDVTIYCYDKRKLMEFDFNIKIIEISLGKLLDKIFFAFLSIHRIIWNVIKLKKYSKQFDLIYCPSSYGYIGGGKNQIITIHDLIALNINKQHKIQRLYFKYLIPKIINSCVKIICISNFTSSEVKRFYGKKKKIDIQVIPNGIDHTKDLSTSLSDEIVDKLTQRNEFCLSVGGSYINKNISTVIEVASRLEKENIQFVIVGRSSRFYLKMKRKAEQLHVKNIHFLEYVDSALLSSLYKKSKVHIYISLYEGFGFPPAEAAYYNTPTIISCQEALLEIYGSYFKGVNPHNVDEISYAIKQEFENQKETKLLVYSHLKEKYNWNSSSDKLFKVIQNELSQ